MFAGDRLFVNAEAQDGSLTVEVLGDQGKPVQGFESQACQAVAADALAENNEAAGWIHWKNQDGLASLAGKQIQLRFTLKNARLYSFRVANEATAKLPTPRATTR